MTDTDRRVAPAEAALRGDVTTHPQAAGATAVNLGHIVQARRALPGPGYRAVLIWIHQTLRPSTYVEIGVQYGESIIAAHPEAVRVAIDPEPMLKAPLPGLQLFTMTSDEFFARHDLARVLGRDHFDLAFIDGLHLFEQALLDFINLERFAGPDSVIVLHDCLPLDAVTAARTRTTEFYSGDVWKLTLCLRRERPDLRMVSIPTAPTGLCIVSGLDRHSSVLERNYAECVRRYMDLSFDDYVSRAWQMPPQIPNRKAAITEYVAALHPEIRHEAAHIEAS